MKKPPAAPVVLHIPELGAPICRVVVGPDTLPAGHGFASFDVAPLSQAFKVIAEVMGNDDLCIACRGIIARRNRQVLVEDTIERSRRLRRPEA